MPTQECLMVAFNQAAEVADSASSMLKLGAVMAMVSAPLAFVVCESYDLADIAVEKDEEAENLNEEENKEPV